MPECGLKARIQLCDDNILFPVFFPLNDVKLTVHIVPYFLCQVLQKF